MSVTTSVVIYDLASSAFNLEIGSGQTSSGLIIGSGELLTVLSGGTAIGITVESGGAMTDDGIAIGTVVSSTDDAWAEFTVTSGGTATGTTVNAAGSGDYAALTVAPGGSATDTTLGDGGDGLALLTLAAGASATSTTVNSGGLEQITVGSGQVLGLSVIGTGIEVTLEQGAIVSAGTEVVVDGSIMGPADTSGVVVSGGIFEVTSGGNVRGTVLGGGSVELGTGATAEATVVSGGFLNVFGGSASDTVLIGAGSGGVSQIGTDTIYSATPVSPSYEQVWNGGSTTGTVVGDGAIEAVQSGGTVISSTVQDGGTEIVSAGAMVSDTVLDVGGTINLTGVAYVSGGTATLNPTDDVLTVAEGGTSATVQLAGNYDNDAFLLTQGDLGGTDVTAAPALVVGDTTTNQPVAAVGQSYSGPVSGLQQEYIYAGGDNLDVTVNTDNWFIHTGAGEDAIAVAGGTNVLDGGTGSNFLVGGSGVGAGAGFDTFFLDDRDATAPTWSTVVNFHSGDAATVWGVTPQDFNLSWMDGQGAAGYTGLTLTATATGLPTASLTLAGLTSADLTNGTLSVSYGSSDGSSYMYIADKG